MAHVARSLDLHSTVALVDDGSNPFELACLTEVLGIDGPGSALHGR